MFSIFGHFRRGNSNVKNQSLHNMMPVTSRWSAEEKKHRTHQPSVSSAKCASVEQKLKIFLFKFASLISNNGGHKRIMDFSPIAAGLVARRSFLDTVVYILG